MSFRDTLAQSIYHRSGDPRSDENSLDPDWQAGYFTGCLSEMTTHFASEEHPITKEWRRRGSPSKGGKESEKFHNWKAGFWSGVWQKAEQQLQEAVQSH